MYQVMLGYTGKCLDVQGYARTCKDVLGYARLYQDVDTEETHIYT